MEVRHLRAFVTVAEELNFRRAAERLQMAQPPLSQQIRRMEKELGVDLFTRTTRTVALTAAGEACLVEARRALAAIESMPVVGQRAAAGHTGRIRLGFTGPASYQALMIVADAYREFRPDVRLEIGPPAFSGELADQVRADALDVALVRLPLDTTDLEVCEIAAGRSGVAMARSHPLAGAEEVGLLDMAAAPMITHASGRGSTFLSTVAGSFLEHGIVPNIVAETPDTQTLMLMVGAGVGIGYMPLSAGYLLAPNVCLVPVRDLPTTSVAMVWRIGDDNPAVAALISLRERIIDECAAIP